LNHEGHEGREEHEGEESVDKALAALCVLRGRKATMAERLKKSFFMQQIGGQESNILLPSGLTPEGKGVVPVPGARPGTRTLEEEP
jgi:hypothetical protein